MMNTLVTKERRASQAAFWISVAVMAALAFLYRTPFGRQSGAELLLGWVFIVAAPYLGALPFGYEFDHQTLSLYLQQPKKRMRLWGEKMLTGIALVGGFTAISLVLMVKSRTVNSGEDLWFPGCWAINSICAGPLMAFVTRSTIGAAGCALLVGVVELSLTALIVTGLETVANWVPTVSVASLFMHLSITVSAAAMVAGALFWKRFQPGTSGGGWLQAHSVAGALRSARTQAVRGQGLRNVVRREWMLQRRTVWAALGVTGLLGLVAYWKFLFDSSRSALDSTSYPIYLVLEVMLPVLMLMGSVIFPLLMGVGCGNDRFLQTTPLSLSQPVPWKRQARTRLLLGLGIAIHQGVIFALVRSADVDLARGGLWVGHLLGYWRGASTLIGTQILVSALCFGVGWLSSQVVQSAIRAILLSAALVAIPVLGCLLSHQWLAPMLVQWGHPDGGNLTWWDLAQVMDVLERVPLLQLGFFGSLVLYAGWLIFHACKSSGELYVQRKAFGVLYASSTVLLLLCQWALGVLICWLRNSP